MLSERYGDVIQSGSQVINELSEDNLKHVGTEFTKFLDVSIPRPSIVGKVLTVKISKGLKNML